MNAPTHIVDVFNMPMHPACENAFPWLSEPELIDLADDIKANGLLFPIVVQNGVLIDGKNRREACRRIGVIPEIRELSPDVDPRDFIISSNGITKFAGSPVVVSPVMPSDTSAHYTGLVMALFGNLSRAVLFGDRRGFMLEVVNSRFIEYRQSYFPDDKPVRHCAV